MKCCRAVTESRLNRTTSRLNSSVYLVAISTRSFGHSAHHEVSTTPGQFPDVKTVADRAGHADPVLTMRQYVHAFDAQRKRAAIPLEALLDED